MSAASPGQSTDLQPVTRAEFYEFIDTYPRKLVYDLSKRTERHLRYWYDPELDEIVASCVAGGLGYPGPERLWVIRKPG